MARPLVPGVDAGNPEYEDPIDVILGGEEKLEIAENALRMVTGGLKSLDDAADQLEFARRNVRDANPDEAIRLESLAYHNLVLALAELNRLQQNWQLAMDPIIEVDVPAEEDGD